jgi:hypothetical protein
MSIVRWGGTAQTPGAPAAAPGAIDAGDSALAAALPASATARCDSITLSLRAHALIRAGLTVRAFVIAALENVYRRVPRAAGGAIVLEAGVYRVAWR